MKRVSLKNISLLFIVMTIILSVIATPAMAAVSTGSVTRSFSTTTPANGSTIIVTLTPGGVVATGDFYGVVETLPAGFTYVSTTATDVIQTGQVLDFTKIGATAFTYTVTAPAAAPGAYSFTGTFVDAETNTGVVAASVVTVGGTATSGQNRIYITSDNPSAQPSWDAQSFAGFFYDIKYNRKTETLSITNTMTELEAARTIEKENLWYKTGKADVEFKVYEKENKSVLGKTTYPVVGWRAEKWIAVNGKANKLAKLVYEMGKEDKKTLTTGETWTLGAGYELVINALDARTTPRQVWFTLKKDGAVV
ncbi:MAG: S-layer protein domain-containing protein, partial [Candidatus Methanoperedens sp.]